MRKLFAALILVALAAGCGGPTVPQMVAIPRHEVVAVNLTPEYVARQHAELEAEIAAETPVGGLDNRLSHYLRTQRPELAVQMPEAASPDAVPPAAEFFGQAAPFVCHGDFDADGMEDTAAMLRDTRTGDIRLMAFHQVVTISDPGGIRGRGYTPHDVVPPHPASPDGGLDDLLITCPEPGSYQDVESGVTVTLAGHGIVSGSVLFYVSDGEYQSLPIAD